MLNFRSPLNEFRRWLIRNLSFGDLAEVGRILIATSLFIFVRNSNAVDAHAAVPIVLFVLYAVIEAYSLYKKLSERKMIAHVEGGVVAVVFNRIHNMSLESVACRITLWQSDPICSTRLIATHRFVPGMVGDTAKEAKKSRVYWERGVGLTGKAWKVAGTADDDDLFLTQRISADAPPEDHLNLYKNKYDVPESIANRLSAEMLKATSIIAVPILNPEKRLLGIVTIDLFGTAERRVGESGSGELVDVPAQGEVRFDWKEYTSDRIPKQINMAEIIDRVKTFGQILERLTDASSRRGK